MWVNQDNTRKILFLSHKPKKPTLAGGFSSFQRRIIFQDRQWAL